MHTRTINAEHVLLACVTHRMRKHNPTLAQFAAISNGAFTTYRCGQRTWTPPLEHRRMATQPLLMPLTPSVSAELVKRVRLFHGLAEVKKTWGIGFKAMLAEVSARRAA